jgi:hypothetical protein
MGGSMTDEEWDVYIRCPICNKIQAHIPDFQALNPKYFCMCGTPYDEESEEEYYD